MCSWQPTVSAYCTVTSNPPMCTFATTAGWCSSTSALPAACWTRPATARRCWPAALFTQRPSGFVAATPNRRATCSHWVQPCSLRWRANRHSAGARCSAPSLRSLKGNRRRACTPVRCELSSKDCSPRTPQDRLTGDQARAALVDLQQRLRPGAVTEVVEGGVNA
jgi:hypothetical protein